MTNSERRQRSVRQEWDQDDLVRRLCHALDIAGRAVEHLAPADFCEGEESAAHIRREKPIAETAVLLYAATVAAHHAEVARCIDQVATALAPHARSASMRLGLALSPALALDYSIGHILLTALGYPDLSFEHLLRHCWNAQARGSRERTPHRTLEQEWLIRVWGCAGKRTHHRQSASQGCLLNQPLDVFGSSDEDLYAFTHAIMYVSEFRSQAATWPRSRAAILAEAEAALARCLDAQDYDLAGELLLAWPLTGGPWSPAAAFAFRVLAEVEDRVGFLPTPATRIQELKQRQGAERQRYLLATSYHTAYVMGLLCAAALQPGRAPPVRLRRRATDQCAARRMLMLLDNEDLRPHWRDTFDRLGPTEIPALAGLLFHMALQRKVSRRDYNGLSDVLRLGNELGLADTPSASQAAELLDRMTVCARTIPGVAMADNQAQGDPTLTLIPIAVSG